MKETIGYSKLKSSVESDCNKNNSCGCFNPNGCDKDNASIGTYGEEGFKRCFHKYCDKFKWITDRAEQYSIKTGISSEEILDSWENKRNYWYMNYYQESNQPEIQGENVRVFDTVKELLLSMELKDYRCPSCDGVSTNPYICNSGQIANGKVCNWNVHGLFGDLGKGANIFVKEKLSGETIFMPIAWEN